MAIFVTSDLHFGHDREFLWGPRGFKSSKEHDEAIIANWNSVVEPMDDVYVLGDIMLGDNEWGKSCMERLEGNIYLIRGNHDTDKRWYEEYPYIHKVEAQYGWAHMLHYRKYHFLMTHFPTLTGNLEKESLHQMTLNLFGHTHSKEKFFEDRPYMYNVSLDANDNTPVLLDNIIERMKNKVKECKDFL